MRVISSTLDVVFRHFTWPTGSAALTGSVLCSADSTVICQMGPHRSCDTEMGGLACRTVTSYNTCMVHCSVLGESATSVLLLLLLLLLLQARECTATSEGFQRG
jgi:hypothetical protein